MPGWLSWLERTAHRVLKQKRALTYSWDTVRPRVRIPLPALFISQESIYLFLKTFIYKISNIDNLIAIFKY